MVTPEDLKPGEMFLESCTASSPTAPVATGWLRVPGGWVGLTAWPRTTKKGQEGFFVLKQGWKSDVQP